MLKKTKTATIALIITVSLLMIVGQNSGYASTNAPAALKIYIGPTSVPADNNSYTCIYVQLLDSSQHPTRALQDTAIGLSSSNTNIGTVKPSITIPAGATYASTSFQTTFSPGSSTIAATASGFATVQAAITTIGPIPAKVAVYGYPSSLPADGNTYNCILVQLQDSSGAPAKAPKEGVQVTLSCSDTTDVGSVASNVTIQEGGTYATASFTTVNGTSKIWSASISGVAQGYTSVPLTITTTPVGTNPSVLKIFSGPAQVPADKSDYQTVALELQNAAGYVCELSSDTSVSLSSSDQTIAQINSQITIPGGQALRVGGFNYNLQARHHDHNRRSQQRQLRNTN